MVEQVKTKDLATLIHHKALQSVFRNRNVCSFQICLDHILSTTRCTELYASLTLDLASSRPYDLPELDSRRLFGHPTRSVFDSNDLPCHMQGPSLVCSLFLQHVSMLLTQHGIIFQCIETTSVVIRKVGANIMYRAVLPSLAQVGAALAVVAGIVASKNDPCKDVKTPFGGDGGNTITGFDIVTPDTRVVELITTSGNRIDGIGLVVDIPGKGRITLYRSGPGGRNTSTVLKEDEYVEAMIVGRFEHKNRDSVTYVNYYTSNGRNLTAGTTMNAGLRHYPAPTGYRLIGLSGRLGKELDAVAPIWGNPDCYARSHTNKLNFSNL
ncbi:unnamed protein product [Peronospora belbahrii]|uniref:Jacalin-type lectin domain-containing protein n=1 Tax=Peronospora belbahrii TaxID=622444 RepID=A0AAU9LCH4_9STRA|nr:unnamed protein product [Peronospora belbahrii]